jgi:MoaA/NifB/PqqE/SkfB family radical SAM enzyme
MDEKTPKFSELGFPTEEMYRFPNIINMGVYRGDCPCSCVHCPVGVTKPSERKKRFNYAEMDIELFGKVVKEVSDYPTATLRLHSLGEPIYWVNLSDAIKMTREKDVRTWLFTSAITKNKDLLETISRNVDIIEVSVNSSDGEEYKRTKGVNAFELVKDNIKYMSTVARQAQKPNRLVVSRVQTKERERDQEFVDFWKGSGDVDDAFIRSYHNYNELMEHIPDVGFSQHYPCLVHWGRMNVDTNGDVVVCFNELFKEHLDPCMILGNLKEQNIVDIWHGERLDAIRKAELSGNYSKVGEIPCKDCKSCQPLQGTNQTSENQIKLYNDREKEK